MTLRKKCFLLSLSLVLLIFIGGCGEEGSLGEVLTFPSTRQEETVLFDEFLDAAFANLASQDTLSLHFTLRDPAASGIARKDAAFADLSAGGIEKSRRDMESLLTQLESFSPGRLTDRQRLVYDTLKEYLTLQLDLLEYTCYEELLSPSSGLHVDLPILLSEYVFSDKQDVEDYLALLDKVDIYFSNIFSYEKEKSDLGLAMNDGAMDQVISFCNTFGTESEETPSPRLLPPKDHGGGFSHRPGKGKVHRHQRKHCARQSAAPSYRALAEKMETLKGTCVNEEGLAHVSGGKDYYTLLVRQATGTKDAPLMLSYRIRQQRETDMGIMTSLFAADPTLASRCAGLPV